MNRMAASAAFGLLPLIISCILSCAAKPEYREVTALGGEVRIDVSALKDGVPEFFSYRSDGQSNRVRVDFFVIGLGGRVESYLDACMKCYPKRKGYRFSEGGVRCTACGESYAVERLGGVGSCYPIALSGAATDGSYVISASDLEAAKRYF